MLVDIILLSNCVSEVQLFIGLKRYDLDCLGHRNLTLPERAERLLSILSRMQLVNYLLPDAAIEESRGDMRHMKRHDLRGGNGHIAMHFKPDCCFVKVIGCDIAALGALLFGKLSGPICHPTMLL